MRRQTTAPANNHSSVQTKFLRLFQPVPLGHSIDGWRVRWVGGWDRCRVFFVVMVEAPVAPPVWIPMLDGRWLILPRHTQPEKDVQAMLDHIQITLPAQPPPRIRASQVALLTLPEAADQPSLW